MPRRIVFGMANIDDTLKLIRRVSSEVRVSHLARLSGLPYMTVKSAKLRGFEGLSVETLRKLEAAAALYRSQEGAA